MPCPSTHHKDTSKCQEAFFLTRSNTKLPRLSFHIYIHMSHGLFLLSLIFVVASVYFDDTCCGKVFINITFLLKGKYYQSHPLSFDVSSAWFVCIFIHSPLLCLLLVFFLGTFLWERWWSQPQKQWKIIIK